MMSYSRYTNNDAIIRDTEVSQRLFNPNKLYDKTEDFLNGIYTTINLVFTL